MLEHKKLPTYRSNLNVWVGKLQADTIEFDLINGRDRCLLLIGKIDNPPQDSIGDVSEQLSGQSLGINRIEVEVFDIESSILKAEFEKSYKEGTIGELVPTNFGQSNYNDASPSSHEMRGLRADVGMPSKAIGELHAQLMRCHSENRMLYLSLGFDVQEQQLKTGEDRERVRRVVELHQLNFDRESVFTVFSIRTGVSRKKFDTELGEIEMF